MSEDAALFVGPLSAQVGIERQPATGERFLAVGGHGGCQCVERSWANAEQSSGCSRAKRFSASSAEPTRAGNAGF